MITDISRWASQANLQVTNLLYVQSLNFQTRAITLFILKCWHACVHLKARVLYVLR